MSKKPKQRGARPSPAPRERTSFARKFFSFAALLFAGALLVGTSVPANAFLEDPASVLVASVPTAVDGQSVEVSADALAEAPARDGYEVITYAQQLREKYANVSYAYTATTGAVRWPFPYAVTITDGYGPRDVNVSGSAFHNGTDFTPGDGTPIYAIADGVVSLHSEDQGGFGNHVILTHEINGQKVESVYAHMQYGSSPLTVGETVRVGDFIGLVGNTGTSYGAHLHLEIHLDGVAVDPFVWLSNNAVN
ncbi:M23 family metallopeptidase [Antiquaquibacter oligotrophicus]|uniref:M23 family metallopeptidase n=1 Tax=Antiquaquibacter oligotrophicus TaxID=2880260 RepID=UPI002AC9AB78|nr:M23 family metallopeptidase [Antiquaquibacter oligotrophicus]UDF12340.1 M23 family metallopeptidase [Antiquaquibacter oligotrophicus]